MRDLHCYVILRRSIRECFEKCSTSHNRIVRRDVVPLITRRIPVSAFPRFDSNGDLHTTILPSSPRLRQVVSLPRFQNYLPSLVLTCEPMTAL